MSTAAVETALTSIYEEIMWLSRRPNVSASKARAWYTHLMAGTVMRDIRRFSGHVSRRAASLSGEPLVLEHFKRIQTALTSLVVKHRDGGISDPTEFIQLVLTYEEVHIVTRRENYDAVVAKGDYAHAAIELLDWGDLSTPVQAVLSKTMLRGRVCNLVQYAVRAEA